MDAAKYQQMLDDLQSSNATSNIFFVKAGKNRYKLIAEEEPFFRPVKRTWQGQARTRFIVKAYTVDDQKVGGLIITKTVLQQILTMLAEEMDLFDEKEGHGISIIRAGQGLETSYTVVPSPKPVAVPEELMNGLTLDDLVREADILDERNIERQARGEGAPNSGKGNNRSSQNSDNEGVDW